MHALGFCDMYSGNNLVLEFTEPLGLLTTLQRLVAYSDAGQSKLGDRARPLNSIVAQLARLLLFEVRQPRLGLQSGLEGMVLTVAILSAFCGVHWPAVKSA